MVVGEPTLMGGEFGDEDERMITRLENTQYDPSAVAVSNGLDDGEDCTSLGTPPVSVAGGPGGGPVGPGVPGGPGGGGGRLGAGGGGGPLGAPPNSNASWSTRSNGHSNPPNQNQFDQQQPPNNSNDNGSNQSKSMTPGPQEDKKPLS